MARVAFGRRRICDSGSLRRRNPLLEVVSKPVGGESSASIFRTKTNAHRGLGTAFRVKRSVLKTSCTKQYPSPRIEILGVGTPSPATTEIRTVRELVRDSCAASTLAATDRTRRETTPRLLRPSPAVLFQLQRQENTTANQGGSGDEQQTDENVGGRSFSRCSSLLFLRALS